MDCVYKRINEVGAKSLNSAVLIHKRNPANLKFSFAAKYTGFTIPNKFVIGYGMDFNEKGRDLPHVVVLNETGIAKYKV